METSNRHIQTKVGRRSGDLYVGQRAVSGYKRDLPRTEHGLGIEKDPIPLDSFPPCNL